MVCGVCDDLPGDVLDCRAQAPYAGLLSNGRSELAGGWILMRRSDNISRRLAWAVLLAAVSPCRWAAAQSCTTQAKMMPEVRSGLADAALSLAQAVMGGDVAKVQAVTVAEFASGAGFAQTAALVQSTATKIAGDTLAVTQIYILDAKNRKAGDTSDADFSCVLTGTTAETDFSISGLPPGLYGFAMVEATGARPFLLALLMEQDAGVWKMAGFYPRARTAAGHDGMWYWIAARSHAKAKELWVAWLFYGEADKLLRPANFATSTGLDKLRAEERSAVPPELADGISTQTPLALKAADGKDYSFTSMEAEGSEDGKDLDLILHLKADSVSDVEATKARNRAAAKALLDAHKELRPAFNRVLVFADAPGQSPLVTDSTMPEIP
jgi:hypothetical protein